MLTCSLYTCKYVCVFLDVCMRFCISLFQRLLLQGVSVLFIDWLTMYQDHDGALPLIGDRFIQHVSSESGELLSVAQPSLQHPGSYCTSIQVRISGDRVTVSGNPSRFGRLDNLFGFVALDDCVAIYNRILRSLGLPPFTRCTRTWTVTGEDGSRVNLVSDGAVVTEIHLTTNRAVGEGAEQDYLRGLSTQRYRNSIPNLFSNGCTLDWRTKKGNARFIYASAYVKGNEIRLHSLEKIRRKHGESSSEYLYLQNISNYCDRHGVVRFEQKIKSAYLRKHGLAFFGLLDFSHFADLHAEYLQIDERLQVESMTIENISERLLRLGIVTNVKAANTTTMYAMQWMTGIVFDLTKSQPKVHRSRLRKIGIDIAQPCDITRHSPVYVRKTKSVHVTDLVPPAWYRHPSTAPQLRIAS